MSPGYREERNWGTRGPQGGEGLGCRRPQALLLRGACPEPGIGARGLSVRLLSLVCHACVLTRQDGPALGLGAWLRQERSWPARLLDHTAP